MARFPLLAGLDDRHPRSYRRNRAAASVAVIAGLFPGFAVNAAGRPPTIPLCPGLQIVTAISQANGDYESIKTVESVNDTSVLIKYSSEQLVTDFLAADFGKVRKIKLTRSVSRADLRAATLYQQRFLTDMPTSVPETTAIGTSTAVLRALKSQGRSEFAISSAYSGEFPADRAQSPNLYDFMSPGELTRISEKSPTLSVLINDQLVAVPVVRATGEFAAEAAEFVFLDDESNPLTLKFRVGIDAEPPMNKEMIELCETMQSAAPEMSKALCGRTSGGDRETLTVVKISHRCALAATPSQPPPSEPSQLEVELTQTGQATIYDIHFSFNSDLIRPESASRLAEIAAVLRKHPEWVIAVNGHTDAVGGASYNLELSKRRAAAVKTALVKQHGIPASHLVTEGLGASQPRDTNETLLGRARNRRVELIRQ